MDLLGSGTLYPGVVDSVKRIVLLGHQSPSRFSSKVFRRPGSEVPSSERSDSPSYSSSSVERIRTRLVILPFSTFEV